MSTIVPFPGGPAASRGGQHNRSGQTLGAVYSMHAGMISWVDAANCECCGRQTLTRRGGAMRGTLCAHCRRPSVA